MRTRIIDTFYDKTVWKLWRTIQIDPVKLAEVTLSAHAILKNVARYQAVSNKTGIPFWVIGALHYREASFRWDRHLHNGDPLTAKTVHVPAGRPMGNPPFSWEDSAVDALKVAGLDMVVEWDLVRALVRMERYNGLGYKNKGVSSPYLWAGTSHYKGGLFVKDGVFDKTVMDKRVGVAPIILALRNSGIDLNEAEPI